MMIGFQIGLGIIAGIVFICFCLYLIRLAAGALLSWIERKEYEQAAPEERVAIKCRRIVEMLEKERN